MPAKVTLRIISGEMAGQEFIFDRRDSCFVGRGTDCAIRVPGRVDKLISRHHCMLDINPPDIRIRDYGSLNGTWINDSLIGWRDETMTVEEAAEIAKDNFSDHDLSDGDRLKLGNTLFEVSTERPIICCDCDQEIAKGEQQPVKELSGRFRCADCHELTLSAVALTIPQSRSRCCSQCGRKVDEEFRIDRPGQYVCKACRDEPSKVLQQLLDKAQTGSRDLGGIRGYKVQRELGRGGMGAVYLARHDESDQDVALKVMLPQVATNELGKQTFLREVENTKVMRHPNVVTMIDNGCADGVFFFTLEYCNGGNAQQLVEKHGGKLEQDLAITITLQTLHGLQYAHGVPLQARLSDGGFVTATGLVHRDLKPYNVFLHEVDGKMIAKVGDFGLSKAFDTAGLSGQTRSGTAAGTPVFMPRQQVVNFRHAKPDVDVWAAAACLYYMLTGKFPRDFKPHQDVWQTVISTDAVPIRKRDSSVPRRLAKVIDQALQDKPQIGFQTAADFLEALEKVR